MKRIVRSALAAGLALAASAAVAPRSAGAFEFHRTINVHPIVFQTFVSGVTHVDGWTCGIFACFTTNGLIPDAAADVLLKRVSARIAIGYDFFDDPGSNPCPCGSFGLAQFRGGVTFRTSEIPDNFLLATLVLEPKKTNKLANKSNELITGIFETSGTKLTFSQASDVAIAPSENRPFRTFDRRHDEWTLVSGDLGEETASDFASEGKKLNNPVFGSFPATTSKNSAPVSRDGDSYRIDVTQAVRGWISDWPNRLDTPLRGFLITGRNFDPLDTKKTSNGFIEGRHLIQYAVTLEIILNEPDL
jgi:hypothetical protein